MSSDYEKQLEQQNEVLQDRLSKLASRMICRFTVMKKKERVEAITLKMDVYEAEMPSGKWEFVKPAKPVLCFDESLCWVEQLENNTWRLYASTANVEGNTSRYEVTFISSDVEYVKSRMLEEMGMVGFNYTTSEEILPEPKVGTITNANGDIFSDVIASDVIFGSNVQDGDMIRGNYMQQILEQLKEIQDKINGPKMPQSAPSQSAPPQPPIPPNPPQKI